jgi:hypothetical protein
MPWRQVPWYSQLPSQTFVQKSIEEYYFAEHSQVQFDGTSPLLSNDVTNDTVYNILVDFQDSNAERISTVINAE